MKIKLFSLVAFACMCIFLIQSCSNEITNEEEFDTSAMDFEIDDSDIAPVEYCRYNVTKSSVPGIEPGDIVCVTCDEPCAKKLVDHVTSYPVNNKGLVSGTRVSKKCSKCPTGGTPI